jgi:DNA-binding NarL/FixJ family response regulator
MSVPREHRTAVLLDPHPLWLDAVERVLVQVGVTVVGRTTSPEEALALAAEHEPSLFLTSLELREVEGENIAYLREVCEKAPRAKVIVLSIHEDIHRIGAALAAGAFAYVVKSAPPDDLASAIRQAYSHTIYLADGPSVRVGNGNGNGHAPAPSGLTRREEEILKLVAEGLSNAQLARRLWVTEQTVKFHLSNVYRKLGVANRTEASRWAQVSGLLDSGVPAA